MESLPVSHTYPPPDAELPKKDPRQKQSSANAANEKDRGDFVAE